MDYAAQEANFNSLLIYNFLLIFKYKSDKLLCQGKMKMIFFNQQRNNLVKLLTSFAGILFATTIVGSFGSSKFDLIRFLIGSVLTLVVACVILVLEP